MKRLLILMILVSGCLPLRKEKQLKDWSNTQTMPQQQESTPDNLTIMPGESIKAYKKRLVPGFYRPVTISCPPAEQIMEINRVKRHEKALTRIEYGIGVLLFGTVLSVALKTYGIQQIGNLITGGGGCIIIHGLLTTQMLENWKYVGYGTLIIGSVVMVYFMRNKGFTIPKNKMGFLSRKFWKKR